MSRVMPDSRLGRRGPSGMSDYVAKTVESASLDARPAGMPHQNCELSFVPCDICMIRRTLCRFKGLGAGETARIRPFRQDPLCFVARFSSQLPSLAFPDDAGRAYPTPEVFR